MAQTCPATPAGQDRLYTFLSIGRHALLLPQSDIRTLAPVQDISLVGQRASGAVGWIFFAGGRWPVYALDEALQTRPDIPLDQRICALLRLNTGYYGLVCAHVTLVQGAGLHIRPVPIAMAMPDSPVEGLVWYADRPGLVSTAAALAALLGVRETTALKPLAPSPGSRGVQGG
jgi:hypothetical protein